MTNSLGIEPSIRECRIARWAPQVIRPGHAVGQIVELTVLIGAYNMRTSAAEVHGIDPQPPA
jgi:hypothetical protein